MIPSSTFDCANMLNLAEQIREALAMFARNHTEPALIGGLAVVAHQVVRATKGVDARRLLSQASERETPMGRMRIISVEGLIGFKLQGYVNDGTRTRDLDDIRALLKVHGDSLDKVELREYFALFNKSELLNELLG